MSASTLSRAALFLTLALGAMAFGAARAAGPAPGSWPQNFSISALEPTALALPLTAAGPVNVTIRSQGAPIVARLVRPAGTVAVQQDGTNELHLSYVATPDDLRASPLWRVALSVQPGVDPRAVVNGIVNVQAARADPAVVNAYVAQLRARRPVPPGPVTVASAPPASPQVIATLQAFEQGRQARRAAVFEGIRPRYEQARANAGVGTRAGLSLPLRPVPKPVGTAPPPPPPPPAIAGTSVPQGEPLDPVEIDGSGFGAGGEVHFVTGITPNDDHQATVTLWGAGQIFTSVPDLGGIAAPYNGFVYVVRADGTKSQGVSFRFVPATDMAVLALPPSASTDTHIGNSDPFCAQYYPSGWMPPFAPGLPVSPCDAGGSWFGYKSNDIFFGTKTLLNGWVVDHVDVQLLSSGSSGAYLADSRPGTNSAYVNVRVWCDSWFDVQYAFTVYIRGPHGSPYQ